MRYFFKTFIYLLIIMIIFSLLIITISSLDFSNGIIHVISIITSKVKYFFQFIVVAIITLIYPYFFKKIKSERKDIETRIVTSRYFIFLILTIFIVLGSL